MLRSCPAPATAPARRSGTAWLAPSLLHNSRNTRSIPMRDVLLDAAERALRYLESLDERPVTPEPTAVARLRELDVPLPDGPSDPASTIAELDRQAGAVMAMSGPRFYGFVIGGPLPAALAANWLAGAWDQNAAYFTSSPLVEKVEDVALGWLVDLLGLPAGTGAGFVTGATV